MAPSKSPVFAVCGGLSVDTEAAGRRRVGKTKRSTPSGLAESLYADLLSEGSAGKVQKGTVDAATEAAVAEDYADVFGGPPKFASLSSQFSLKRGMARVSDASTNGTPPFHAFAAASPTGCSSAFDILNGVPGPHSSFSSAQELRSTCAYPEPYTHTLFAAVSNSAKLRDSDKRTFIKRKEDAAFIGDEFSVMPPPGPAATVKTASTILRRIEVTESDGGEDAKDIRVLKPMRRGLAAMKENVRVPSNVPTAEHEGPDGSAHARTASSPRRDEEVTQKCTHPAFNMKAVEGRRHNLKVKKKGNMDDVWITIKDVKFSTEPSRFPPPSRAPPGLSSDGGCALKNTAEAVKQVDDWSGKSNQTLWEESNSASRSFIFSSTQESDRRDAVASAATRDAMEMAEAKIRMVIEAKEKAKLMVEKKIREKQRDRWDKEANDAKGKVGKEQYYQELARDSRAEHEKPRVRCCEDNMKRNERERKRDLARQCVERATLEVREKAAAIVQERAGMAAAELRTTQEASERPVGDGIQKASARSASDKAVAEATPRAGDFLFEKINREVQRRCAREAEKGPEKVVIEDDINVTREQQQAGFSTPRQSHAATDALSSFSCNARWRSFTEAAGLQSVSSTISTRDDLASFSGGNFGDTSFQEIVGETRERRKARWDRHCRTSARVVKALEEKKQRDLQSQREQTERHRAGEMLDDEIKSWAAGKEGNLQALLCSLQYVLWPECGWQPVLPDNLSTAAAVKKAYRKATLCVHPDKVQQKGATIAQKYTAEKVFDLLKEASVKSM